MGVRIIDLSATLENASFEPWPPEISYYDHREGARLVAKILNIPPASFPEGMALAWETVHAITHTGTHIDAPWHFGPTSEGKPSKTVDQVPLEWCYADGVRLDFTRKKPGETIAVNDVKEALSKIDYKLKPLDIVLMMTGADKYIDEPRYASMHAGPDEAATLWIIDQGVKIIGIDAYTFDRPFKTMEEAFKKGEGDALFPSHFAGRKREYCHIEKLANLDKIPKPYGFKVAVFPVKIAKASGAWARPVAIIEE